MHIIGTAGHVDHGKSSLVKGLTGTDPDRFVEEQIRGMTLDLGFAYLRLPDGQEAGIVDVPGHERFLHNMLAGAAGMELLLLVVAADDGVMPQTLEHLEMLKYLNVGRTILVVTKSDLVGEAEIDGAIDSIRVALQGTIAQDAPAVAISNVTGSGYEPLLLMIARELQSLHARDVQAPVYLPIDRVFSLAGHGTIITGTLMQGRIAINDHLVLQPSKKQVRIRSIQVFGQRRDTALGGERVAVSLPGIARNAISRGEVLADASFEARPQFEVRFKAHDEAISLLRRRTPVRVYLGAAEILGRLIFPEFPETSQALLMLAHPVLAFPGVRFVVRQISPKTLLGGGEVLARSDAATSNDSHASSTATVLRALKDAGTSSADLAALSFATNLRDDVVRSALAELDALGALFEVQKPQGYLARSVADGFLAEVVEKLQAHQEAQPWSLGITTIALARMLALPEARLAPLIAAFAEDGQLARRSGYYATTDHTPRITAEQRSFVEGWFAPQVEDPLRPTPALSVFDAVKKSQIPGMGQAFDTLMATGAIVKVGDELYRGAQIATVHAKLEAILRANGTMTVAQFRDMLGITRKYAVPLLEWFDSRGITMRNGDLRVLRTTSRQGIGIT